MDGVMRPPYINRINKKSKRNNINRRRRGNRGNAMAGLPVPLTNLPKDPPTVKSNLVMVRTIQTELTGVESLTAGKLAEQILRQYFYGLGVQGSFQILSTKFWAASSSETLFVEEWGTSMSVKDTGLYMDRPRCGFYYPPAARFSFALNPGLTNVVYKVKPGNYTYNARVVIYLNPKEDYVPLTLPEREGEDIPPTSKYIDERYDIDDVPRGDRMRTLLPGWVLTALGNKPVP